MESLNSINCICYLYSLSKVNRVHTGSGVQRGGLNSINYIKFILRRIGKINRCKQTGQSILTVLIAVNRINKCVFTIFIVLIRMDTVHRDQRRV